MTTETNLLGDIYSVEEYQIEFAPRRGVQDIKVVRRISLLIAVVHTRDVLAPPLGAIAMLLLTGGLRYAPTTGYFLATLRVA